MTQDTIMHLSDAAFVTRFGFLFEHSAGDLVHRPHPDRRTIRRGPDEQGHDAAGRNCERRAHVGEGWRAGAIVGDQLPVGMGTALEADADAVQDRGQRQRGGQRRSRAVEAEEAHAGGLQGRQ